MWRQGKTFSISFNSIAARWGALPGFFGPQPPGCLIRRAAQDRAKASVYVHYRTDRARSFAYPCQYRRDEDHSDQALI
jgi:hypothetical protein